MFSGKWETTGGFDQGSDMMSLKVLEGPFSYCVGVMGRRARKCQLFAWSRTAAALMVRSRCIRTCFRANGQKKTCGRKEEIGNLQIFDMSNWIDDGGAT